MKDSLNLRATVFIVVFIYYIFLSRYSTNVNKIMKFKKNEDETSFFHSFNDFFFFSTNNFSHINNVLGVENTQVSKTDVVPALMD